MHARTAFAGELSYRESLRSYMGLPARVYHLASRLAFTPVHRSLADRHEQHAGCRSLSCSVIGLFI